MMTYYSGQVYTTVYEMTYDHCGERWTTDCTCVCDGVCRSCSASVKPTMFRKGRVFRDTDLEANAPGL